MYAAVSVSTALLLTHIRNKTGSLSLLAKYFYKFLKLLKLFRRPCILETYVCIPENPLHCGCAQQEVWEWLRDHQKMISGQNEIRLSLKCEQPPELRGRSFLELDPPIFCTTPLVLKLAIQDIQPFSVIVSWQSRNNSGVFGYKIVYNPISQVEYNTNVSKLLRKLNFILKFF